MRGKQAQHEAPPLLAQAETPVFKLEMLPRPYRLTKSKDIELVARRGRSFFTKILGIKYLPNRFTVTRFAIVVGLKVHKKAVKRNRPKRQLREALRKHLAEIRPGHDVLVLARPEILEKKFKEIEGALLCACKGAGLLKN